MNPDCCSISSHYNLMIETVNLSVVTCFVSRIIKPIMTQVVVCNCVSSMTCIASTSLSLVEHSHGTRTLGRTHSYDRLGKKRKGYPSGYKPTSQSLDLYL